MVAPSVDEAQVTTWRLDTPSARQLAAEVGRLEDLQTVLQCCERLLAELTAPTAEQPGVEAVVESLWLTAVSAYQRCFAAPAAPGAGDKGGGGGGAGGAGEEPVGGVLVEQDVLDAHPEQPEAADWHRALVALRPGGGVGSAAPAFTVGAVRGDDGSPLGIAVTSPARVLPDELVVRGAGTIAYALSVLVEARIGELQVTLFDQVAALSSAQLDGLMRLQAAPHR